MYSITAEDEAKYLAKPTVHKAHLHPRPLFVFVGVASLFYGLGQLFLLSAKKDISLLCLLIEMLSCVAFFVWLFLPCRCGKTPLLSAKGRLSLLKQRSKHYQKRLNLIVVHNVIAFTILLLSTMFVIKMLLGPLPLMLIVSGFHLALGSGLLITSLTPAVNHLPRRRMIMSQKEQEEIAALSGGTEEELHKLIALHLKAGNFENADAYSRKLLALAETAV